jgi:hypothetical protein
MHVKVHYFYNCHIMAICVRCNVKVLSMLKIVLLQLQLFLYTCVIAVGLTTMYKLLWLFSI